MSTQANVIANGDAPVAPVAPAAPAASELASDTGAKPTDEVLHLGSGGTLTITADSLIYRESDKAASKRSRSSGFCGVGGSKQANTKSIPLYNVLWAEHDVAAATITIDYANQASTTRLRVAKLVVPASAAADPEAAAPGIDAFVTQLLARAYGPAKQRKRAYVIVNPNAGPGIADKLWGSHAAPIFRAARTELDVVRTEFSGQAVDLVAALDIDKYDTVVACSGDGLPHEVFNGLGKRPDARQALKKIAVSHIPCGSGNAMSCNLYGTHRASLAALAIIKGVRTTIDLVSITQGDRRFLSFLSQALGIVADSDLGTEHLRWMGGARFTYGLVVRVMGRKTYPCDLAIKVAIEHKDDVRKHYHRERSEEALRATAMASGENLASRVEGSQTPEEESDGSAEGEGLPKLKYGTVKDELPEGWELVPHDKLGNFYCGNMAYMAPDANFFSAALANDGFLDLVTVDGDISPVANTKLLLSVETGHFFDSPLVTYRKVEAYRIIPRQKDGYISIDGERVPFEPFQVEMHQGLGTVLSKRGMLEAPGPRNWDSVTVGERLRA